MNNELKHGDIYFHNDILTVTFKQQEAYNVHNHTYGPYDYFEVIFLGKECKYMHCNKESIDKLISKRLRAYNLIPEGCKIIPKYLVGMYRGMFIGGILEDSIQIAYGISEPTIRGFSCSVFFIPSEEVLATLTDYDSVSGALKIKGDNYDISKM